MDKEQNYTSTGIKFWCHKDKMENYLESSGHSIISTHISSTSICNLNCKYCSVKKRDKFQNIDLDVIKDYVIKLKSRGLKAVILTGGGEPTLYENINDLISWLNLEGLKIALITNGTFSKGIEEENWKHFSWIRISLNVFSEWKEKIWIPLHYLHPKCIVGCSFIVDEDYNLDVFREVSEKAKELGSKYIRLLPNCLYDQKDLLQWHDKVGIIKEKLNDDTFFHQFKIHGTPVSSICHQSYFRPYLSEVDGGTVYPCDSLVLNDNFEEFARKFQICKAEDILEFLDGKIQPKFNPQVDCTGCVFTNNIEMLNDWRVNEKWNEIDCKNLVHKDFV